MEGKWKSDLADDCGRLLGFFAGSAITGFSVFYWGIEEYKVSNELLTEDIYVSPVGILNLHTYLTICSTESPSLGTTCSYLRLESGGEIGFVGKEEEMSDLQLDWLIMDCRVALGEGFYE